MKETVEQILADIQSKKEPVNIWDVPEKERYMPEAPRRSAANDAVIRYAYYQTQKNIRAAAYYADRKAAERRAKR